MRGTLIRAGEFATCGVDRCPLDKRGNGERSSFHMQALAKLRHGIGHQMLSVASADNTDRSKENLAQFSTVET